MGKRAHKKVVSSVQNRKSKPKISAPTLRILSILLILFVAVVGYWNVFDEKLDLNGDNTAYYLLGKSINSGKGFTSSWDVRQGPHTHYPVGYPFLIAIFMFVSESVIFIKIVNLLFYLASLLLLFHFTEQLYEKRATVIWAVLFVALNSHLLRFSTIMMSEISFLFFSLAVLYALTKVDFTISPLKQKMIYFLILSLAFAYHVRTIGIAIIFGVAVYLIISRHWKHMVVILSGTILLIIPWSIRNAGIGKSSYVKQLLMVNPYRQELGSAGLFDFLERIFSNLFRYVSQEIPSATLPFVQTMIRNEALYGWIIGIFLLVLTGFGLYRLQKYRTLLIAYLIGIFGILLLWPNVWFGIRFIIPVLPLLIVLAVYGLFELSKVFRSQYTWSKNMLIAIILVGLIFTVGSLKIEKEKAESPYPKAYKNYFQIAKWVRNNTQTDAVICCRKTTVFTLFSQRLTAKYKFTNDSDELINLLDRQGVDYVVVEQLGYGSTPRYLVPAIQKNPQRFKQLIHLKNPDTFLLKFEKQE